MVHVVGIADMKISNKYGDKIITYALGSCLGISVYDHVTCVGGLLHVMLPTASIDPGKSEENPLMFVDTGVPILFNECYKLGAVKSRLSVKVAGGASLGADRETDRFRIGDRNFVLLRKLFWKNNILMESCDVGLDVSRIMSLEIGTGRVEVKTRSEVMAL